MLSGVNIYYYYDNCCAYPEKIEFSYSLNGVDYLVIDAESKLVESYNLGAQYSYTFAEPINPVGLKIKFTQQSGTSGSHLGCANRTVHRFGGYSAPVLS